MVLVLVLVLVLALVLVDLNSVSEDLVQWGVVALVLHKLCKSCHAGWAYWYWYRYYCRLLWISAISICICIGSGIEIGIDKHCWNFATFAALVKRFTLSISDAWMDGCRVLRSLWKQWGQWLAGQKQEQWRRHNALEYVWTGCMPTPQQTVSLLCKPQQQRRMPFLFCLCTLMSQTNHTCS